MFGQAYQLYGVPEYDLPPRYDEFPVGQEPLLLDPMFDKVDKNVVRCLHSGQPFLELAQVVHVHWEHGIQHIHGTTSSGCGCGGGGEPASRRGKKKESVMQIESGWSSTHSVVHSIPYTGADCLITLPFSLAFLPSLDSG